MIKAIITLALGGYALLIHAENWPCFRGPTGQGISIECGLPLYWSKQSNLVWKTPIGGEAWSSPIIWSNCVFITTARDAGQSCHVLCLDRDTGTVRWDRRVFAQEPKRKESRNSYATPTPVTDGNFVYAVFGDGSFVALDYSGSVQWTNRDYPHYSQHGLAVSPILFEDLLIMPRDGSSEGEDKALGWQKPWDQAYIIALDKHTGKERWKAQRGSSRIAHVTPNVLWERGAPQLISGAGDVVQGFNLATGKRIWTFISRGEGVVPSIVLGEGLVYSVSGFPNLAIRAVRTGGQGDVTQTHLAWEQKHHGPAIASLLYIKPFVYSVSNAGIAMCLDALSGDIIWQSKLGGHYSASPIYADGYVYFLSEEGGTVVIRSGARYQEVARNPLDEPYNASMAVSEKKLFIRTDMNLYCLGCK